MVAVPFLLNDFFTGYIYPFVLVFVLVFAILDKTKILGEGKRQINAIISLMIALLFVTVGGAVGIVVRLMPFLAVMLVIILVFYLMMGFAWNEKEGFTVPKGMKYALGGIIAVSLVIALLIITGYWSRVIDVVSGQSSWTSTIFLIVIIVAAMVAVLYQKNP